MEACASTFGAQRILPQANRVGVFEGLGGGVQGVGHVGMDAGDSVFGRACAHAAGDGFVIGKGLAGAWIDAADGEVVHGARGRGRDAIGNRLRQRFQKDVDNSLRSFDVTTGNGGGRFCVDHGSRRSDDTDGAHEAGGRGHVFAKQAAEDVEAGGVGDRLDCVDRALDLWVAAGEVDGDMGSVLLPSRRGRRRGKPRLYGGFVGGGGDLDGHGYAHGFVFDAIVIEKVLGLVAAGRDGAQKGAHHFFGIDEQIGGGMFGAGDSVAGADFAEAPGSGLAGGDLSAQVAFAFFGRADIVEEEGQHIGDEFSATHDFDGRDAEAFLVDFAAGAHGAWISSADIGVVSAGSDVEVGCCVVAGLCPARMAGKVHRHHQRDIGEVRAAAEGVVEHDDVAGFEFTLFYRGRNRHGHGAQVHRHVIAHGDDLAFGIEDGAGVVAALFDIGREGSAAQCGSHFLGDGMVKVLENLEFDGVVHLRNECTSLQKLRTIMDRLRPGGSMKSFWINALILALSSFAMAKEDVSIEDLIKQHLSSIGTEQARTAVKTRVVEGGARFRVLSGGNRDQSGSIFAPEGGELQGKNVFVSEGNSTVVLLKFPNPSYHGERFVAANNKSLIAEVSPGRYSDFGDFIRVHDEILTEGLWGGVLSTGWPLAHLEDRGAKLRYKGFKKIDGKEFYVVGYLPAQHSDLDIDLYFEPQTFRHILTTYSLTISPQIARTELASARQQPTLYLLEEQFMDFQRSDDLLLPARWIVRFTETIPRRTSQIIPPNMNGRGGLPRPLDLSSPPPDVKPFSIEFNVVRNSISHNVQLDPKNFEIK